VPLSIGRWIQHILAQSYDDQNMQCDRADEELVVELLNARDTATITGLPSQRDVSFSLDRGYGIGRALHERLLERGYQAAGRKIGFTNPALWREFNLNTPAWAPMYAQTVHFAERGSHPLALDGMVAPRIEPEVVFKLRRLLPSGNLSPREVAPCLEWAALAFEIVDSHYPEWRCTAADAVADFGFHAALVVGTPWCLEPNDALQVATCLQKLTVSLHRGSEIVAQGEGGNALGSPLLALGHLARVLAAQPCAPPLLPGEVITTGTLTSPPFVSSGDSWRMEVVGAPMRPLEITLCKKSNFVGRGRR
jgi:2-oxo-3-hexenedioate decarboxylase